MISKLEHRENFFLNYQLIETEPVLNKALFLYLIFMRSETFLPP